MSQFMKAVEVRASGMKIPVQRSLGHSMEPLKVTTTVEPYQPFSTIEKHRIEVRWSWIIVCSPETVDHHRKRFLKELADIVYGDARVLLRTLRVAAMTHDSDLLYETLNKLEEEFYQ